MTNLVDVKDLTQEYWEEQRPIPWYIEHLLPREMTEMYAAKAHESLLRCKTLALLVGFSPEPLLQSIWAYAPQRIVLVLNRVYGQRTGAKEFENWKRWISLVYERRQLWSASSNDAHWKMPQIEDAVCPDEASSEWVFATLRDKLLHDQRVGADIIVDITGAKKSMVSGAFLFAAFAGVPVSYVDFDKYDEKRRRPLGYTCRIEPQPNPYATFGLRDWTRVQQLYTQYAFDRARTSAEQILAHMRKHKVAFSEAQCTSVELLCAACKSLEAWDNGDYRLALNLAKDQPWEELLPSSVVMLGLTGWPSSSTTNAQNFLAEHKQLTLGVPENPHESFYCRTPVFLAYAHDELKKIERLITLNEDYRSALLRSAGLLELLLVARACWLALCGALQGYRKNTTPSQPASREEIFAEVGELMAGKLQSLFRFESISTRRLSVRIKPDVKIPVLHDRCEDTSRMSYEALTKLRNKSIHTHLSIPRTFAEAALQFAEQSLHEYEYVWLPYIGEQSSLRNETGASFEQSKAPDWKKMEAPDWSELCAACGLDFLPALPKE